MMLPTMTDAHNPIAYTTSIDAMFSSEREPSNAFKDIRSGAKPRRRTKAKQKKYFNFENIKAGQLGAPHYQSTDGPFFWWPMFSADFAECPIVEPNKKQLYQEAQRTKPSYMTYRGCSCCRDLVRRADAKEHAAVKAEAADWDKRWLRRDFAGQFYPDERNYDQLGYEDAEDWLDYEWYRWDWDYGSYLLGDASPSDSEFEHPQTVYDLETMVNNAMAGLRALIHEPGWDDLVDDAWSSPEMDWVQEGAELFEDGEDFELV